MPIATYQGKTFSVSSGKVYTLDGLEWSGSINSEAQDKLKSKSSTYIKGLGLETMSFDVQLRADLKIDVRKEIEAWEAIRDKCSPAYFVLGTKPLSKNKWLLKSVSISDTRIDNKGRVYAASLNLSFEEYVRAGVAPKETAAGKGKRKGKGKPASGPVNLNLVPTSYIDKVETKRQNTNAATAPSNSANKQFARGT